MTGADFSSGAREYGIEGGFSDMATSQSVLIRKKT
jgi:hypothetical protein